MVRAATAIFLPSHSLIMQSNPRVPFELSSARFSPPAPQGRPLICHIVVNVEYWPFEQPMPRSLFNKPHGISQGPDIANFCWVEHGLRAGIPRLLRVFGERGLPVSAAMNADVIDVYPSVAEAVLHAGWKIMGHGLIQRSLEHEKDEVAVIHKALEKIAKFSGHPPRSWLGPGLGETLDTPDHLAAAGVRYIYEWAIDDLPVRMNTRSGVAYAMPYALELNDVLIFSIEKQASHIYFERFRDSVDVLGREAETQPRVLTLALHPHVIAQPHRLDYLCRTLKMLQARSDTVFMTCDAIGDWYHAALQKKSESA